MGHYVCKTCSELKEESEFRIKQTVKLKSGPKSYKDAHCIPCSNKRKLKYKENNPYTWIANRYKVSREEAKYWYTRSMGSCEICGYSWKQGTERLCIDHNHKTGKVRGVLCKHCNHLLGHAKESLEILDNAKAYLFSHREN